MNNIKKIYFVGIKGVGMTPLALVAKEAGFEVAGSDIDEHFITDEILSKNSIHIDSGFSEDAIKNFIGGSPANVLVITTAAHNGFDNPQVVFAKSLGVEVVTHGQAVGLFMTGKLFDRTFRGISVAGAHGKTTITAMLATALINLELDPSYIIGTSNISPIGAPGHFGQGEFFVAEADEYFSELKYDRTPKFLYQRPEFLIINNIDFDHPDVYQNLDEVLDAYRKFIENLKNDGVLIINGDDENSKKLMSERSQKLKVLTIGTSSSNTYSLGTFKENGLSSEFIVNKKNYPFGSFTLSVPGIHNALNALSVIAFLDYLGVDDQEIKMSLSQFKGTKRRLEHLGQTHQGALLFDDYAHHPQEIKASLSALQKAYPDKKIVCIFQPHTYSRTLTLLNDFSHAFGEVAKLVMLPIFASEREKKPENFSEAVLQQKISDQIPSVEFMENDDSVVKYVSDNFNSPDFVIVTMGAGNVYKIAEKLI